MKLRSNLSKDEIESLVAKTRLKVDQIIAEEKAEKAAERALKRAAAVYKAATTGNYRAMPEGMTVVAEEGRANTLTPNGGNQTASAGLTVDEKREAAQQQLKSLMSKKQTPLPEVATAGNNGTMSQYR